MVKSRRVEEYIPKAIEAVEKVGIAKDNKKVPQEFNGYISSFGASIRQAGLLATVMFFESKKNSANQDRTKVLRAIEYIIFGKSTKDLIDKIINDQVSKQEIEDAAVALKLAVRTFEFDKSKES